jgi:hypothetical protein
VYWQSEMTGECVFNLQCMKHVYMCTSACKCMCVCVTLLVNVLYGTVYMHTFKLIDSDE